MSREERPQVVLEVGLHRWYAINSQNITSGGREEGTVNPLFKLEHFFRSGGLP